MRWPDSWRIEGECAAPSAVRARDRIIVLFVACLLVLAPYAEAAEDGYLLTSVSSGGAMVRLKGMFSRYKSWPSMYSLTEQACADAGGMKRYAAMRADPHDWLCLHVEPPDSGVVWGSGTEFTLVTAAGETLRGGPVLLTDSPVERQVWDARARSVLLQSKGGPYGRSRLGHIVIVVGFPEGSLDAEHGEYWATFDTPARFTVVEQGGAR